MGTRGLRIPHLVLTLVWALWVGFTATPLPHRCEMSEPAAAQGAPVGHEAGHHEGHHGSPSVPASCHCVGHACCSAVAAPAAGPAIHAVLTFQRGDAPILLHDRLVEAPNHLLPFPLGPPAVPQA